MISKRLVALCIFSIALLLLSSPSLAAEEKPNACKAKYEKDQDASLKQHMTLLPKQNVNLGRGKTAIKDLNVPISKNYKYYTKFNKADLLMAYDAFVVKPNGEVEVFSEYNGRCYSMGFISGQFVSTFPAHLEDSLKKYVPSFKMPMLIYTLSDIDKTHKARYRRVNYASSRLLSGSGRNSFSYDRSDYEMTFLNAGSTMVFIRLRNKPQYYYTFGASEILVASSPYGNLFSDYDISNLPEKVDQKSVVYLKISCQKKDSKGRSQPSYPWPWQNDYDSFAVVGDCSITRETPATLKGDKKAIDIRKKDWGMYDLSFSTTKRGISFMVYPYSGEQNHDNPYAWPNDKLYRFVTYGNERGLSVEGVTINNDPSSPFEVLVASNSIKAYNGLKTFTSGSNLNLGLTPYANYDKLLFSSNYYEKVKSEGMFIERDNKFGVRNRIQFYNLLPGTPNYNRLFMAQSNGRLRVYKSYNAQSQEDCNIFTQYDKSYELRNFISSCYFFDNSLIILQNNHMFPSGYTLTSYGTHKENYNVEFEYLRQRSASSVNENNLFRKIGYGSSQYVNIWDKGGVKVIGIWPNQVFTQAEHYAPFKWTPGVMGELEFSAKIYDSEQEKIRKLFCSSLTGKCFLDGVQISSPRQNLKCKSNSDCGPEQGCNNGLCIEKPGECKDYINGGSLDVYFYGVSMTNDEMKSYLDKSLDKMLKEVEPFASNRRKFTVKYNSIGHIELDKNIDSSGVMEANLKKIQLSQKDSTKCSGSPDYTVYIAPITSSSLLGGQSLGNNIIINTKNNPESGWFWLSHELAHSMGKSSFGNVVDEYTIDGRNCATGVNCNLPDNAERTWSGMGYPNLKSTNGCGGCNYNEVGKNYIRPDGYSIMNNNPEEAKTFNIITNKVLLSNLARYS